MEKIYQQKDTGIIATYEKEAEYFMPKKVLLEVHYAATKEELEAGKNIHVRQYEINISDDIIKKLLEIHSSAIEIK